VRAVARPMSLPDPTSDLASERAPELASDALSRSLDRDRRGERMDDPERNEAATAPSPWTDRVPSATETLERLRLTFAALAEGVMRIDPHGRVIESNPAAERILGVGSGGLRGRTLRDARCLLVRRDGRACGADEDPLAITRSTGMAIHALSCGVRRPDGELRWLSLSTVPLMASERRGDRASDRFVESIVVSFADVTEREEQSNRLDLVVQGAGLGTWDWFVATGRVAFNDRWSSMLGYEPHEIEPTVKSWERLVHPDDMPRVMELLTAHLEGRTPEYRCEHRLLRKDGSWGWVLDVGRVMERDSEGKPTRASGVHVDISEFKRVQAELEKERIASEARYREVQALRLALDEHSIISVADRSGRIIDVNTGFCRVSGYAREELLGQDHRILNSGHQSKEFWVAVWRQITAGHAWRGEVCNRRKDGTLYWVDSTIVPCLGADGRVERYVSIRFDITGQKESEERLKKAQADALAADAAKSEFLANMSHEIRTPMTAILGFTELLANDGDQLRAPPERLEHIETIRRNGEHLLAIINDILDLSKIEAGKLVIEHAPTDPVAFLADIRRLMDVRAKAKSLRLEVHYTTPMPASIMTDPMRLRQILVNLVGNALKFTEVGGVLLRVGCDPRAERLTVEIEDSGIGMTEAQLGHLFDAFMQGDASVTRRFGGTGLGLRISQRLAGMLGGAITVRSVPGQGSVFTLTIATGPVAEAGLRLIGTGENAPANERVASTGGPAGATEHDPEVLAGVRILLAEDGPDNQRLIGFHLRKAGADVRVVENGRLAIEALSADGTVAGALAANPRFDLLLTDMQMPEMDGYTAAALLRAKGWNRPIVALTAHAMSGDRERCLAAGCDGYATKPIDRNALIEACRAALARRADRRAA
jgi:PAS domain S-box-containing protein